MSLEDGEKGEQFEVPKDAYEMITKYFTFQNTGTPRERAARVQAALQNDDLNWYGAALSGLSKSAGFDKVISAAQKLRQSVKDDAAALRLLLNDASKDISWAMIDMGKAQYLSTHPDKRDKYGQTHAMQMERLLRLGISPLRDMSNRELARAAFEAYKGASPTAAVWKDIISKDPAFADARRILDQKISEDQKSHPARLTELGNVLHHIARDKREIKGAEFKVVPPRLAIPHLSEQERKSATEPPKSPDVDGAKSLGSGAQNNAQSDTILEEQEPENERLRIPETPEEMVKKYLAFQSYGTDAQKANRINAALSNAKVMESAAALIKAAKKYGMEHIIEIASDVQLWMGNDFISNKIASKDSFNEVINDISWALIDLGLMYKPKFMPDGSEKRGGKDPFDGTQKADNLCGIIADRKLAYYANLAYRGAFPGAKVWKAMVDAHQDLYSGAYDILRGKLDRNGELTAEQLLHVGKVLHTAAERIEAENIDLSVMPAAPQSEPAANEAPPAAPVTPNATPAAPPAAGPANVNNAPPGAPPNAPPGAPPAGPPVPPDYQNTIAREMRHSLRSIKLDTWRDSEAGHRARQEVKALREEDEEVENGREGITLGKIGKASLYGAALIPAALGGLAVWEFAKTSWQSLKGMFGVLTKLTKSGFSFKALNKSPDEAGGAAAHAAPKHEAHANDNHAHADHGGGHGHDDHGGGHGGGAHAKGHAKGGHANDNHAKKPAKKGANKKAAAHH